MPYDPERHHRRSIRLKGYDYTQPGAYFITICTHDRACLFGEVVEGQMRLNEAGHIAQQCWTDIPNHFPHIQLDEFIIMPNHVHGILVIVHHVHHVGARHAVPPHGMPPHGMPPHGMPPHGMPPHGMPPHGMPPHGMPPHGMPPHGMPPHGMPPHGMPPHGMPPHGMPPHGMPPHGMPPHGMPPHGMPPHGMPPHGMPPHGMPPHGMPPHGMPPPPMASPNPTVEQFGKPVHGSLPTIVRSFKSATTRHINILRGTPGAPVWQRNYYEHIIRNEDALHRIRQYIATNPLRWHLDRENADRTGRNPDEKMWFG
nr:transposase [Thermosynechococcus sp. NK55a]